MPRHEQSNQIVLSPFFVPVWRRWNARHTMKLHRSRLEQKAPGVRSRGIGVNETNCPKKRPRKHPKFSPMTRYAKPEFGNKPLSFSFRSLSLLLGCNRPSFSPIDRALHLRLIQLRSHDVTDALAGFAVVETCADFVREFLRAGFVAKRRRRSPWRAWYGELWNEECAVTECAFRGTNWRTNFKPSFFLLFKVFKDVAGQIEGWGMFLTLSRCGEKFNDC